MILIRKLHGWDHGTACAEIDKIIGTASAPIKPPNPIPQRDNVARRLSAIERVLAEAHAPHVVADYLNGRGIVASSPVLRGHARCPYFGEDNKKLMAISRQ